MSKTTRRKRYTPRRLATSLVQGKGYKPSDGSRTFLVSLLVEVPEEHDDASVEDAFTCMTLDTLGEVAAVLASSAREVRALRP